MKKTDWKMRTESYIDWGGKVYRRIYKEESFNDSAIREKNTIWEVKDKDA